jgi:hypothetical protein
MPFPLGEVFIYKIHIDISDNCQESPLWISICERISYKRKKCNTERYTSSARG